MMYNKMKMDEVIDLLIEESIKWIKQQRNNYISQAVSLNPKEKELLRKWFNPHTINSARVKTVPLIENPSFYEKVARMELYGLPDMTQMEAFTFGDVIVVAQKYKPAMDSMLWHSLLFHELVRASAFRILGVNKFVEFYINDWMKSGFSFEMISLEVVAGQFQKRFENYHDITFSVEEELREYIKDLYRNQ